ncbi:unnamed protein product [Blepharisma stoltei]|uniref:Mediator of RNA polymerase II transcription subunit 4 n=1 Tax=Blepharisma stoltei TaxID=1481888 RepID=A0AAU9IQ68_9CILI|nr:unnamed protein product [Blepharisma stoltei]
MDLLKSLKNDLKTLKLNSIQHFQQLKNNPYAQASFDSLLAAIQNKIIDLKICLEKQKEIEVLKEKVQSTKETYYKHCKVLINTADSLESKIESAQCSLDVAKSCRKIPVKELLLYAHRISGTVSAPTNWNNREPQPVAFRVPVPEEHEIRASTLFYTDNKERTQKPIIRITTLQECYLVTISCSQPNAVIRYTLDNSLPSVLTGKKYDAPFDVSIDADFCVKAVAVIPGLRESEIASSSVQDTLFQIPTRTDIAERPVHTVITTEKLNLGMDLSPFSSSRQSSDDENDYSSMFSFTR